MGIQPNLKSPLKDLPMRSVIISTRNQGTYYFIKAVVWIFCGSATDFLCKVIYQLLSSVWTVSDDLAFSIITTLMLSTLAWLSSVLPTLLCPETRKCISSMMTWKFLFKLMIPSWLALLVTCTRYGAIILVAPSVVSITKTSFQVVTLTFINMCWRKNLQSKGQLLAIFAVLVGNAVVFVSSILVGFDSSIGKTGVNYVGLAIAAFSGYLGGLKNIAEELLLQKHGVTSKALILVESVVSLLLASIFGSALVKVLKPNLSLYFNSCTTPGVIPAICAFVLTMYCKQLGKYQVMKFSGAITVKIISLVFPFGTWALSLLTFYCITEGKKRYPGGDEWNWKWSPLRLLGFIIIVGSVWLFKAADDAKKIAKRTFRTTFETFTDARRLLLRDSESLVN